MILLKNLLFTFIGPGIFAVLVPWIIARKEQPASGSAFAIAVVLFGLGGCIYAWCVWDFALYGRGTPAPFDAPKRLVIRGLYRFVRNPMYLGILTILLAWAVLFQTLGLVVYAVIVTTCFHIFILLYEEPHLQREFGDEYLAYKAKIGRWFPRFPPNLDS